MHAHPLSNLALTTEFYLVKTSALTMLAGTGYAKQAHAVELAEFGKFAVCYFLCAINSARFASVIINMACPSLYVIVGHSRQFV